MDIDSSGSQPTLQSVQLKIPNLFSGGAFLSNSVLLILPHSSNYCSKYIDLESPEGVNIPFQYVEVDRNTEGLPRGSNGSFINPHYDFHYYTKSREYINQNLTCITSGKICDDLQTGYA